MSRALDLPLSTRVNGVTWNLYAIDFKTCDGTYSAYLYAVSPEHAQSILDDLKDTAEIGGKLEGIGI